MTVKLRRAIAALTTVSPLSSIANTPGTGQVAAEARPADKISTTKSARTLMPANAVARGVSRQRRRAGRHRQVAAGAEPRQQQTDSGHDDEPRRIDRDLTEKPIAR